PCRVLALRVPGMLRCFHNPTFYRTNASVLSHIAWPRWGLCAVGHVLTDLMAHRPRTRRREAAPEQGGGRRHPERGGGRRNKNRVAGGGTRTGWREVIPEQGGGRR